VKLGERLRARLGLVLFAVLALATVAAFSITQHLKTQNPLINGAPRADPPMIDPRFAGVCPNELGKPASYRSTSLGFFLQSKSDDVTVDVIDSEDVKVATMTGSGRYIHAATAAKDNYAYFGWDGKLSDGRYAPDGIYTFRVLLSREARTLAIESSGGTLVSVQVTSSRPTPRVSGVTVNAIPTVHPTTPTYVPSPPTSPVGATPYFTPTHQSVTVHLVPGRYRTGNVLVYRATGNAAKPLELVKTFGINPRIKTADWDGMIDGRPAPAGTYLLGLRVTNSSCTSGRYPVVDDPAPHSTAGAGVNVSYLSAQPPINPVPAGQLASVGVNAGGAAYHWALRRAGQARVIFHGVRSGVGDLRVQMPGAGLYFLTLASDGRRTSVPVVASAVGPRAAAKVLVVLPALSWQGANATDDDSDGLIDTLANGSQVDLERPLVAGLPSGTEDEAALLNFLDAAGDSYDVTTDVALAEGVGPSLRGRSGVLLDGTFSWLPAQLVAKLSHFVTAGGCAFADGIHSLQSAAQISDGTAGGAGPVAGPARPLAVDPFGVRHGTVSPAYGQTIFELTDGLGIFSTAAALEFPRYQVLTPVGGRVSSAGGVADSAVSIVGFKDGSGTVVEVGLPDFGSSLSSDVDSGELLSRVWQVVLN
jgi:hypothetical protein